MTDKEKLAKAIEKLAEAIEKSTQPQPVFVPYPHYVYPNIYPNYPYNQPWVTSVPYTTCYSSQTTAQTN